MNNISMLYITQIIIALLSVSGNTLKLKIVHEIMYGK